MGLQLAWRVSGRRRLVDAIETARIMRLRRAHWVVAITAMGRIYTVVELDEGNSEEDVALWLALLRSQRRVDLTLGELLADVYAYSEVYVDGGLWEFAPPPRRHDCCHYHDGPSGDWYRRVEEGRKDDDGHRSGKQRRSAPL